MNKIISIKILENYHIQIQFQDGETKTIDFQPFIGKGVSALLLDKEYPFPSPQGLQFPFPQGVRRRVFRLRPRPGVPE